MTRFVTLNQFVNTWECDENDHLNVQFYFDKFDDASRLFLLIHGLSSTLGRRMTRHVRYHAELRSGAQIRVSSSLAGNADAGGYFVQHIMEDTTSDTIAATALDHFGGGVTEPAGDILDIPHPLVRPRGITTEPDFSSKRPSSSPDATISRGILHPDLCDADGFARDRAYIGAVSDAAAHSWDRIGMNSGWLETHGLGRIAVEMRLHVRHPMGAGTAYEMQLALTGLKSRAFTKRYDFFDLRDGRHMAFLESAVMLLNHTTRRSEPLPNFAREAIEDHLS